MLHVGLQGCSCNSPTLASTIDYRGAKQRGRYELSRAISLFISVVTSTFNTRSMIVSLFRLCHHHRSILAHDNVGYSWIFLLPYISSIPSGSSLNK